MTTERSKCFTACTRSAGSAKCSVVSQSCLARRSDAVPAKVETEDFEYTAPRDINCGRRRGVGNTSIRAQQYQMSHCSEINATPGHAGPHSPVRNRAFLKTLHCGLPGYRGKEKGVARKAPAVKGPLRNKWVQKRHPKGLAAVISVCTAPGATRSLRRLSYH